MQGMELAGRKMSRSQQEEGGREGGFISLSSVHTLHQNAGSESRSSPMGAVIKWRRTLGSALFATELRYSLGMFFLFCFVWIFQDSGYMIGCDKLL